MKSIGPVARHHKRLRSMFICRVIGSVVSTAKHDSYKGCKLLLTRPTTLKGELKEKGTMVAVDSVDAGVGDWVLVVSGGGASFDVLDFDHGVPLREVAVAIIDRIDVEA